MAPSQSKEEPLFQPLLASLIIPPVKYWGKSICRWKNYLANYRNRASITSARFCRLMGNFRVPTSTSLPSTERIFDRATR
jgi:hypothetical protein